MAWVTRDFSGVPFWPMAHIGKGERTLYIPISSSRREAVTINSSGTVIRQEEIYVSPRDMRGEAGRFVPEGIPIIDNLKPNTDMVLVQGLIGMSIHT